jgi:aldehyde dehydrogenase (NAD+)
MNRRRFLGLGMTSQHSLVSEKKEQFMKTHQMYIDGNFCDSSDGRTFPVENPATEEQFAQVPAATDTDVDRAVNAARVAFDTGPWPRMSQKERIAKLMLLVDAMKAKETELYSLESEQSGIPIRKTTLMDIPIGIEMFRTMVEQSDFPLYEPLPWTDFPKISWNFVQREPIGVCAGISAWNFPWLFTMWKSAPSLAMGNTLVFKPASYTPLSSLEFAKIVHECDFPPGVVNVITGSGDTVGERLCTHPLVDKMSFTGSSEVGQKVQKMAAGTLKRLTLELGGKSANIVLDDAHLDLAAEAALFACFFNAGQSCEAGTRLLVQDGIYDRFMATMLEKATTICVGAPDDFETTMGPLISESQRARVESYIQSAHEEGAELVFGGGRTAGMERGYYIDPTIFTNVTPEMRIFQEEIFGPVLAVTRFKTLDDAICLANDSMYGLGGAVWTRDLQKGIRMAKSVRTGTVWINDYHLLNANAPFGGYKMSGSGHEMSTYTLKEYTQMKHIHVDLIGDDRDAKFWMDYTVNRD